jgi:hypothetical protein
MQPTVGHIKQCVKYVKEIRPPDDPLQVRLQPATINTGKRLAILLSPHQTAGVKVRQHESIKARVLNSSHLQTTG